MGAGLLLAFSALLQYTAAFLALRLTRITRRQLAWFLIASAILLMAVRRSVTLYRLVSGDPDIAVDPLAEGIALLISVLMVSGIAGIGPMLRSIEGSRSALRLNEARLRQIIDLVPHMIYAKDWNGRFLLANQAVADAYGRSVKELPDSMRRQWSRMKGGWSSPSDGSDNVVFDEYQQTQYDRIREIRDEIKDRSRRFARFREDAKRRADEEEFNRFMSETPARDA